MIKQRTKEYSRDSLAVRTIQITFLGIPIYNYEKTSTNKAAVAQFTAVPKITKVKGFSNETED